MRITLVFATLVASLSAFVSLETASAQVGPRPATGGAATAPRPTTPTGVIPTSGAGPTSGGTNVAVLDVGLVFKALPKFRDRMETIKKQIQAFDDELAGKKKSLQTLSEQLKAYKPGSAEYKNTEEKIASIDANVRLEVVRKRNEFLKLEAQAYSDQYAELLRAVKSFADAHRIDLVIRYSTEPMDPDQRETVLKGVNRDVVFHRGLDITNQLMQMMDPTGQWKNNLNKPATPVAGGGGVVPPAGGNRPIR